MHQKLYTRSSLAQPLSKVETAAEEANRKLQEVKRLAKWKPARIAPTPSEPEGSSSKEINDEILERCTRCPSHRKRRGTFRPLIGNDGEFLCDPCYQSEFPATAFLDDTDKSLLQRKGKKVTDKIRNKVTDMLAEAMGTAETDDLDQASMNDDNDFPSEIECRQCLEQGVFRRCCSSYYCHSCYHRVGTCPGCEQEVPLTGIAAKPEDPPGKVAIRLSWVFSSLLLLLTVLFLGLFCWNEYTSPTTVFGHSCRGFFPKCDLSVCIDYDGGLGYGEGGSWVPVSEPYRVCDRESTSNQVVGSACIYDNEMYAWSNSLMGYDLCISSPREEQHRSANVSDSNPLLLFAESSGGVYVFDDDFELPRRTASAPWQEIINGNYSDDCGVSTSPPERGNHGGFEPLENRNALVFTGVYTRHAMTKGVNVEHEGTIEFYLKMGPLSNNPHIKCKAAYDGDVTLEYCLGSDECVEFAVFEAWKYRGHLFHFLSVEIPQVALGNSTSFRFRQKVFDASRDHWALDDVRIRANLQPGWQASSAFAERRQMSESDVQLGACCYGTDQCSVFDEKKSNFQPSDCDVIPEFSSGKPVSRMRSSELYILFCLFAFLSKIVYRRVFQHYTSRVRRRKSPESQSLVGDQFPRMTFHSVTQLTWQYTVASILLSALVFVLLRLGSSLDGAKCFTNTEQCYVDSSFVFTSIIALAFDLRTISIILRKVLIIERPMEFMVDLHPEHAVMQIEGKRIPLADLVAMQRRSVCFVWILSLCYVLGGLPIALGSLMLRSYHLHGASEIWYKVLGFMAILREIFGASYLAKFYLCAQWILASRNNDREVFARALRRKGVIQQFFIGAALISLISMSTIWARQVGLTDPFVGLVAFASCLLMGGFLGALVGIMHGLPVVPEAYLTCWPTTCYGIDYNDKAHCPCLFSCTSCSEMNSRHVLLVVMVDEMLALKKLLSGTLGI